MILNKQNFLFLLPVIYFVFLCALGIIIFIGHVDAFIFFESGYIDVGIEGEYCGNGVCNGAVGESCSNCVADCGVCPPPVTPPAPAGAGGGGGGGVSSETPDIPTKSISSGRIAYRLFPFVLEKSIVYIKIKQGQEINEYMEISNNWEGPLLLQFSVEGIEDLASFSEDQFIVFPDKNVTIDLLIKASKDYPIGSYPGKLYITGNELLEVIGVVIDVVSPDSVVDVDIKLDQEFYIPDSVINSFITLTNLGDLDEMDIDFFYSIKDLNGKVWFTETSSLVLNDLLVLEKSVTLPNDIPSGDYIFFTRATYNGTISDSSSYAFKVLAEEQPYVMPPIVKNILFYGFIILLMLGVIFFIIRRHKNQNKEELVNFVFSRKRTSSDDGDVIFRK